MNRGALFVLPERLCRARLVPGLHHVGTIADRRFRRYTGEQSSTRPRKREKAGMGPSHHLDSIAGQADAQDGRVAADSRTGAAPHAASETRDAVGIALGRSTTSPQKENEAGPM